MATANELFAANGEDYIVIDSDLRTMTFPASVNNIGVENDKDVHKLNFKMPRYFSGYDLSEFTIHINYVNANGDADMYYVLDPTINENEIIFSWLVGRHACLYRGSVTFIVCLKLADGEGDVAQEFNTTLASLQVLPGLETEPTILETEHDIIEQLLLSINDTNAKIKAVLDTGLTSEQIAEFYNKSKNYGTEIAAINSRIIYDSTALSMSGTVLGYLNKLPNGVRAYAHTWQVTSDMPSSLTDTMYVFKFVTDAANRVYDYVILIRINNGEQWFGKVSDANLSTRTLSWIKFPSRAEIDALNSRSNYKVIQTQLALPSSVSISAGVADNVFKNADLRTYTVDALDTLPTSGTLKAALYLWSNSAACVASDILIQGGKLTMSLRNVTPVSVTISSVRLLLIYEL